VLALLRHGSVIVCCGTLRVFGTAFAECPFLATKEAQTRRGHCRAFLGALEALLAGWGVRALVLPSVPQTQAIFTRSFGFVRMTPLERLQTESRIITPEASTSTMLIKRIVQPPAVRTQTPVPPPPPRSAAAIALPAKPAAAAKPRASAAVPSPPGRPRHVPGSGSFASLAGSLAEHMARGGPASAAHGAAEEMGHAIADALLSTLGDADAERRAAQAEKHALSMALRDAVADASRLREQLAQAQAQLAALGRPQVADQAAAEAAPPEAPPAEERPPPLPTAQPQQAPPKPAARQMPSAPVASPAVVPPPSRGAEADDGEEALQLLHLMAGDNFEHAGPLLCAAPADQAMLPLELRFEEDEAGEMCEALPADQSAAAPVLPPSLPEDAAMQILRSMPPGQQTWIV
jgi:hypothetical protein